MGTILIDPHLKVSRNGLVTTRSTIQPIGFVEPARRGWVSKCQECDHRALGRTQNITANDLWDHWTHTHASTDEEQR